MAPEPLSPRMANALGWIWAVAVVGLVAMLAMVSFLMSRSETLAEFFAAYGLAGDVLVWLLRGLFIVTAALLVSGHLFNGVVAYRVSRRIWSLTRPRSAVLAVLTSAPLLGNVMIPWGYRRLAEDRRWPLWISVWASLPFVSLTSLLFNIYVDPDDEIFPTAFYVATAAGGWITIAAFNARAAWSLAARLSVQTQAQDLHSLGAMSEQLAASVPRLAHFWRSLSIAMLGFWIFIDMYFNYLEGQTVWIDIWIREYFPGGFFITVDDVLGVSMIVALLLYLLALVGLMIWTFRAVQLARLTAPHARLIAPTMAAAAYVIPVLWFVQPYLWLGKAWRATSLDRLPVVYRRWIVIGPLASITFWMLLVVDDQVGLSETTFYVVDVIISVLLVVSMRLTAGVVERLTTDLTQAASVRVFAA